MPEGHIYKHKMISEEDYRVLYIYPGGQQYVDKTKQAYLDWVALGNTPEVIPYEPPEPPAPQPNWKGFRQYLETDENAQNAMGILAMAAASNPAVNMIFTLFSLELYTDDIVSLRRQVQKFIALGVEFPEPIMEAIDNEAINTYLVGWVFNDPEA